MIHFKWLLWLVLVFAAVPAYAHAPVPGVKGFYIGLVHPFSTPSQALVMIGLGLMAGSYAGEKIRWLLGAFLIVSMGGLVMGAAGMELETALYAIAVAACGLAALLPGGVVALSFVCVVAGALLVGSVSIPDEGPTADRLFTMSGSIVGANIGLLYLAGLTHFVRQRFTQAWVAIGFRVVAAWLGAIALLMLALGTVETGPPV